MEISGNDDTYHAVKLNMKQVHHLMSHSLPEWVSKTITPCNAIILDTIHACTAEEQHRLMLVFPEEVMAYTLFMMNRNAHFMDRLIGKKNRGELDRLLDRLQEIKEAEEREEAVSEEQEEDSERQAVH